nr:ribonuclease H-like domain-containing protein [Tanacetum cinerariifolium]
MHDPREPHFLAIKRVLRYVRGTLVYGLQLFSSSTSDLVAYSDADLAGFPTIRRSTSGYCIFLGNNLLSWSSKRQPTLSCSSAETECHGVASVISETCWLRIILRELHTHLSSATLVYCETMASIRDGEERGGVETARGRTPRFDVGSAHGSFPLDDDEDNSPAEEVSPVKPKKPSKRVAKTKKDDPKEGKEAPKEWTVTEEITLCQCWYDVSENSISENSMKAKGFWEDVIWYFEKETSSTRGYDSIVIKWKNRRRKKFKTSETTSGSVSGGINLNEEADESVQDTQEFQPMGRDRAKAKKKGAGSSRGGSFSFVDLVADKFFNMKQKKEGQGTTVLFRDEESGVEYLGGRGSRNCTAEKGETRNSASSA